ncbi:hypothetical protein LUZ60_002102 [Juncus effusus]|nr:hypothetical protein LUZ60_002102 [Juncus effusus]
MEFDGSTSPLAVPPPVMYGAEAMWQQISMRGINSASNMVSNNKCPERAGEPDCAYYLRTGLCRYGPTCRFNHPPDRQLAIAAARIKGEYPERPGQPECQYYLKTGTCKFGPTCKFHHPKDKAGIEGRVSLNSIGFPLRPGETECSYYLKTLQCKFGPTCKFHHPDPADSSVVPVNSYNGVNTTNPDETTYTRASFIPPSSYPQLIVPQGMVPYYSTGEASMTYSPPLNAIQRENIVFPERPDQPECQYYMKTGDCKFGTNCKFHHPKDRQVPSPDCILSPLGLPLRPGEPVCKFYLRYGICKFGPNCKFDHPMATPVGLLTYGYSTASMSTDMTGGSQALAGSWPGQSYAEESVQSYAG